MVRILSPASVSVISSFPYISVNQPCDVGYSILNCVRLVEHAGWSHGRLLLGVLVVIKLIFELLLIAMLVLVTLRIGI